MFFHILPVGLHWIFKTNAQENQLLYRWGKLGFKSLQDLSHITRLWREGLTSSPHAFQSQAAPPHLTYSSTWEMMPCRRCTVWGVSSLQPPHPGEVLAWPWLCREESCTEWKLDELPSTPWCCERMNCQNGLSFPLAPTWKLPQPRTYFIPIFHPAAKHAWLFATTWIAACQAPLSSTLSWSLLKFVSIDSVKLSNYLTLCHPLLLLLPIFPNVKVLYLQNIKSHRTGEQTYGYQRENTTGEAWIRSLGLTYTRYIKQIIHKGLLHSTGNSTQHFIMTYMGKESKKEWIRVHA